jgi:hypothetical protein
MNGDEFALQRDRGCFPLRRCSVDERNYGDSALNSMVHGGLVH